MAARFQDPSRSLPMRTSNNAVKDGLSFGVNFKISRAMLPTVAVCLGVHLFMVLE